MISSYKDLNTEVVYCLSSVIGQNVSRQLATSSENLVASTQFLVALATTESQFWALIIETNLTASLGTTHKCVMSQIVVLSRTLK